jgi:hypothetical protein
LHHLRGFAEAGGLVIAAGPTPAAWATPDRAADLFGFTPETDEVAGISAVIPVADAPLPRVAAAPRQHMARAFRGLDPASRPLLRLAHEPRQGGAPLVAWYRPWGTGAAVFYAGQLAAGDDWMASPGMLQAFLGDLLGSLPEALGMPPLALASTPGVFETPTADGCLAWNATEATRAWRGVDLAPWAIVDAPALNG